MHSPIPDGFEDIRLVVTDMDGTLLDPTGNVPDTFWPVHEALLEGGVHFALASGRQYPAMHHHFQEHTARTVFIAENGAYVVQDGRELDAAPLAPDQLPRMIRDLRQVAERGNLGLVWSGRNSCYVEDDNPELLTEVGRAYYEIQVVPDLLESPEEALTLSVIALNSDVVDWIDEISDIAGENIVVPSGEMWVDITAPGVHKGVGVRALQERLGITPEQTMTLGDWLNDVEMMRASRYSVAMGNAHPTVLESARHVTTSNAEDGLVRVLQQVVTATTRGPQQP